MREDESASTPTTPPLPIKTMFLASVTPLCPSQSTASADHSDTHTYTAVSTNQHTTPTCNAPTLFEILLQTISSHHMSSRGLGGDERPQRKATCTLCILGRPASFTYHTEEPQRKRTGAPCASLCLWGGGHGRLRGCKRL